MNIYAGTMITVHSSNGVNEETFCGKLLNELPVMRDREGRIVTDCDFRLIDEEEGEIKVLGGFVEEIEFHN